MQDLILLLSIIWAARDTHGQFLVTYMIEELSQGRKDLYLILDRVLHSDHGGTSLGQISHHLFRVVFVTSRPQLIPIGLHKGQPKEAMADDVTVDPMRLLLIKVIKEPLVGVKEQLLECLSQRAPGVFSVMVHTGTEVVDTIVPRVDEGVFAIHDAHKSESKCVINKSS